MWISRGPTQKFSQARGADAAPVYLSLFKDNGIFHLKAALKSSPDLIDPFSEIQPIPMLLP